MKRFLVRAGKNVCLLLVLAALYAGFMFAYVHIKFTRIKPLAAASPVSSPEFNLNDILFIHAVNTPERARAKDARYNGFEIDLNFLPDGRLAVAHDESQFSAGLVLDDILSAVKRPEQKAYWLDLKVPLSQQDIDGLKQTADRFRIPYNRFIFETSGGETARLLTRNGFTILLQVIDGFNEDGNDPAKREALNREMARQLEEYRPAGVSGSLGKYVYLRAYFPHVNKAIYTSTTKRPSLKKQFMARYMKKNDPSVKIFMLDEYTALPF